MKKRVFLGILVALLLILSCVGLFGCKKKSNHEDGKTIILYLGDSIGEAVAGPSPLTERENYGYYGIVGKINGYEFYNRAVSGYQTGHLYSFIQREDDGVNLVKSLVSTSDIIHISILGNDLLGYDISKMIVEAADNVFTEVDKRLAIASENLDKIITYIKDVNPDCTIIMQTLYNPIGEDSPLVRSRAREELGNKYYSANQYHKLAGRMIERLNRVLYDYLDENSTRVFGKVKGTPFELVDVYSVFEDIYKRNPTRWQRLFCPDGIHPSNEGHALIAEAIQKKLEELELASSDALNKYKEIRYEQLDRLYKGIINVGVAKSEIEKSGDMADVTLTYFNQIENKTPYYENTLNYEGEHFTEDVVCKVDKLEISGNNLTSFSFGTMKIELLTEDSGIWFYADGRYELKLDLNPILIAFLQLYIQSTGSINVSSMIGLDLVSLQGEYLQNMIPGIDYQDFEKSLSILEKAYGVGVAGIDFDKESVRKTVKNLAETGQIVISDKDILEEHVTLSWSGQYRLQRVTSRLTNETYTAIYINGGIDKGETYMRYTLNEGENGKKTVRLTLDVVNAVIEGTN